MNGISNTMAAPPLTPPESSSGMSAAAYVIVFSLSIIILSLFITLACCYICKINFLPIDSILLQSSHSTPIVTNSSITSIRQTGLDKGIIDAYPKLLYSEAKLRYGTSTASCCSICLGDYKDNDMLLLLPDCSHLFHVKCVNQWFQLHLTCPMCRKSPSSSSPLSVLVPGAENEMTPMPLQQDGIERQSSVLDDVV